MGIPRKLKPCTGTCGKDVYYFADKKCLYCYNASKEQKPLKRTPLKSGQTKIKKVTAKTAALNLERGKLRNTFFEHHIALCRYSEEDGTPIPYPTKVNIAHIFYKRIYKSVQANFDNCVYLTWEQHTRFDQLLDCNDFERLEKEFKCWPLVVERMTKLLPEVKESGKLKQKFKDYINETLP